MESKTASEYKPENTYYGISGLKIRLRDVSPMKSIRLAYNKIMCEDGYYLGSVTGCRKLGYDRVYCSKCFRCDKLCTKCFGPGDRKCSECVSGLIFIPEKSKCSVGNGNWI